MKKTKKSEVQAKMVGDQVRVTGLNDVIDELSFVARDGETESRFYVMWTRGLCKIARVIPNLRLYRPVEHKLAIGPENKLADAEIEKVDYYRGARSEVIHYVLNGEQGMLVIPGSATPTDTYQDKTIELERLLKRR